MLAQMLSYNSQECEALALAQLSSVPAHAVPAGPRHQRSTSACATKHQQPHSHSQGCLPVHVPHLYHYDPQQHVIIMQDLGTLPNLRALLTTSTEARHTNDSSDTSSTDHGTSTDHQQQQQAQAQQQQQVHVAAHSLGSFLAKLHFRLLSAQAQQLVNPAACSVVRDLVYREVPGRLRILGIPEQQVLQAQAVVDILMQEMDEVVCQAAAAAAAPGADASSRRIQQRQHEQVHSNHGVIMGDLWPSSVLLQPACNHSPHEHPASPAPATPLQQQTRHSTSKASQSKGPADGGSGPFATGQDTQRV